MLTPYAAPLPPALPGGSYVVPAGPSRLRGEPVLCSRQAPIRDAVTTARMRGPSEPLTGVVYPGPAAALTREKR